MATILRKTMAMMQKTRKAMIQTIGTTTMQKTKRTRLAMTGAIWQRISCRTLCWLLWIRVKIQRSATSFPMVLKSTLNMNAGLRQESPANLQHLITTTSGGWTPMRCWVFIFFPTLHGILDTGLNVRGHQCFIRIPEKLLLCFFEERSGSSITVSTLTTWENH